MALFYSSNSSGAQNLSWMSNSSGVIDKSWTSIPSELGEGRQAPGE
jgi:hypothetical protein